jgi:hypothetical protein
MLSIDLRLQVRRVQELFKENIPESLPNQMVSHRASKHLINKKDK